MTGKTPSADSRIPRGPHADSSPFALARRPPSVPKRERPAELCVRLAERHSALSPPHVDLLFADTDLLKAKALIQTPSWVDAEDVQAEGTLSARAQVDESLDDRGPKAEVLQLGAHFDTGQVEVVFTPLDVHDTNQETAHLNDLSVTSVL